MSAVKRKLNGEQVNAGIIAMQGKHLKIFANAGTGKTTLLSAIARNKFKYNLRGLYITFSNKLVKESKSSGHFPRSTVIKSAHSLAFQVFGRRIGIERCNKKITPWFIAKHLNLRADDNFTVNALSEITLSMVNTYMQSADKVLSEKHLASEYLAELKNKGGEKFKYYRHVFTENAQELWRLMSDYEGDFPSSHDVYFKLWVLSEPLLDFDYIMVDESQDLSYCMVALLKLQRAQVIMVYDTYQSIYQFRGASDAIESFEVESTVTIRQSFRFGPQIAFAANHVLNSFYTKYYPGTPKVNILGLASIKSVVIRKCDSPGVVEAPKGTALLARSNVALIKEAIANASAGNYIHLPDGVGQLTAQLEAANNLRAGGKAFGELAMFSSWDQLIEMSESRLGAQFKPLVEIVEEGDIEDKVAQLKKYATDSNKADFTYCTAHKAKGSQFPSVVLLPGFIDQERIDNIIFSEGVNSFSELPLHIQINISQEINLLYVALTRAMSQLNVVNHADLSKLFIPAP